MATNAVVARRRLALELRRSRLRTGLTIEDVAAKLECSPAKISRMETGVSGVRMADLRAIADVVELGPAEVAELAELVRATRNRQWWQEFADVVPPGSGTFYGLEDGASRIRLHSTSLIPGVLQTPGYARALFTSAEGIAPDLVERRLALRLRRQRALDRADPPRLTVVLDEAVLCRRIGGREVMAEQWEHILHRASTAGVVVRVVPFTAEVHAAEGVGFTVFHFDDQDLTPVVYAEQLSRNAFVEDPDEVAVYVEALDAAERAAAPAEASRELIVARARDES
jgi:transcriptional regulator with XRE-family HTH domain